MIFQPCIIWKEKELSTNLLIFQGREKLQPKPLAFKQREDTREGWLCFFKFSRDKINLFKALLSYEGVWTKLISRETLLDERNKYGDSFEVGFEEVFPLRFPFSYVLKDGLKLQTPKSKNRNFQALLKVSYCQDMSPFMDDLLRCESEPVDSLESCSSNHS